MEYEEAGFTGCIGSMDATHVLCERIPHDLRNLHTAFKLQGTARTYNLVRAVVEVKYFGAWLLVDSGYHAWLTVDG